MKIDRLYTLDQFVDYAQTEDAAIEFSEGNVNYMFPEHMAKLIIKYNDFLKQPLRKEMFVNEYGQPTYDSCPTEEYENAMHMYEKGENKVIFEESNDHELYEAHKSELQWALLDGWSLKDIADATLGQLKLKNIEL